MTPLSLIVGTMHHRLCTASLPNTRLALSLCLHFPSLNMHGATQAMRYLAIKYKAGFITVSVTIRSSSHARCNTDHALPCYLLQSWLCHYFCNYPSLIARTMQHRSCAASLSNARLALLLFLCVPHGTKKKI